MTSKFAVLTAAALQVVAIWTLPLAAGGPMAAQTAAALVLAGVQTMATLGLGLAGTRLLGFPARSVLGEGAVALFLGVGLLGLGMLVLGLASLSSVLCVRVLMTVLGVVLSPLTVRWLRRAGPAMRLKHRGDFAGLLMGGALALMLALRAAAPPVAYDVLTYHLAVPRQWLRAGTVFPVPGNFYSHQPFAVEMNDMVALALGTDRLPAVAAWFNLGGLIGVIWAVFTLGRALGLGRALSRAAALLVMATPLIFKVCTDVLVDIWVVLGVLATVHALRLWLVTGQAGALRAGALALGILATVKHPAAVIWAIPLLGLLLVALRSRARFRGRLGDLAAVLLVAALPVVVWCAKEWAWSGNPIFPLAHGVLGGEGWSEAQARLLVSGHGLRSPLTGAFWSDVVRRLQTLGPCPLSLLVGACLLAARRRQRATGGLTLAAVLVSYLIWNLLAGSADRFVAPAVGVLTPLGLGGLWTAAAWARRSKGRGGARWASLFVLVPIAEVAAKTWISAASSSQSDAALITAMLTPPLIAAAVVMSLPLAFGPLSTARLTGGAALVLGALLTWTILVSEFSARDSAWDRLAWVLGQRTFGQMTEGLPHLQAHRFLNEVEHPEGKVLLVAEARTFHLDAPAVMGTVFDGQPLRSHVSGASNVGEVLARLRADGVSHVLVNFHETFRLTNTYFALVQELVPPEIEAARPLWDFPTPLSEKDWEIVRAFHRWAQREAIWQHLPYAVIARVPGE